MRGRSHVCKKGTGSKGSSRGKEPKVGQLAVRATALMGRGDLTLPIAPTAQRKHQVRQCRVWGRSTHVVRRIVKMYDEVQVRTQVGMNAQVLLKSYGMHVYVSEHTIFVVYYFV